LLHEQTQDRTRGFGDSGAFILHRRYKLGHMEKALRGYQPEFGKMATYRIDGLFTKGLT
jgi:hypothetical protein